MATTVPWSVAKHDTVPAVDLWIVPLQAHAYLFGLLNADGGEFTPPYAAVRDEITHVIDEASRHERPGQAPSGDVSDQRIRTWKALFESFGFLFVDDQRRMRLTPLGRLVKSLYDELNRKIEGANDHLAKLAVDVLARHTLANPLETSDYPADSDLKPYTFMWRAMRQLDDKLHWEEMNRVLMKVNYRRDEQDAIAHIASVRKKVADVYDATNVELLGSAAVDEGAETRRRVTPWFARAGFGGLLVHTDDDDFGFRHLVDKFKPLIDYAIQQNEPVPAEALVSRDAYLRYLTDLPTVVAEVPDPGEEAEISRLIAAVERFGGKKIICLAGLPGTGKTRLAKMVARRLVNEDPYRFAEIQFHEGTSYDNFMEGFTPRPSGEGYELTPMTFRIINRRARLDPTGARYVLLIEEFTRANIHAVLGELLTYIEHRDRPFRLTLSQEEERVAPNLAIIATMNPRDRSATVLDHAILRRLHQVPLDASTSKLRGMLQESLDAALLDQLVAWFDRHRESLPFGHAEFAEAQTAEDMRDVWAGTLRFFLLDAAGEIRSQFAELAADYPWRE